MMQIHNHERFYQGIDFGTFPAQATDVDAVIHAKGKCWCFLEAKVEGTGITVGQEIFAKQLVEHLGRAMPAFFAVANHDTKASEDITGQNLLVSKVWASAPHMGGKVVEHTYTDNRPTWDRFSANVLLSCDAVRVLREEPRYFDSAAEEVLEKTCRYLWKAVANEHLMIEWANLDYVDDEDLSEELLEFIADFGFHDHPDHPGNKLVLFEELVFQNWLLNRHHIRSGEVSF